MMERRTLGHTGIPVSALSLGSWMTFETMDEQDALAVIKAGLDAGMNFLDDARYDDRTGKAPIKTGYSEVLFGRLLRQLGVSRGELVIANKLWFEFFPTQSMAAELDASLSRLEMDYLDIVYCERRPEGLPMGDMLGELDRLIATGKLRAWGVLNWSAADMAEAVQVARAQGLRLPAGAQLAYSALNRGAESDAMTAVCVDAGIGIVASYSLEGGLLTGKYRRAAGEGRLAERRSSPAFEAMLPKVETFVTIAGELGCTPSQLALAYCLANPRVCSVVFGSRRVDQVEENVGALAVLPRLRPDVLSRLRAL